MVSVPAPLEFQYMARSAMILFEGSAFCTVMVFSPRIEGGFR
jgi:hypothetical protein